MERCPSRIGRQKPSVIQVAKEAFKVPNVGWRVRKHIVHHLAVVVRIPILHAEKRLLWHSNISARFTDRRMKHRLCALPSFPARLPLKARLPGLGARIWGMTLARTERTENFSAALKTMLDCISDTSIDELPLVPSAHQHILNTTWDELLTAELIQPLPTGEYILTGRGWTAAVIATGQINDPSFQLRIGTLFAALKGLVKGRGGSVTVAFRDIVNQTGLPEGFVFNIIEGRYMEEVSKRRGASWVKPGRLVLVPVSFGIEPTDLRTLLDPAMIQKLEHLEDELYATRDDLSRFRCPHCNSDLIESGAYPIGEHDEGDYERFSCGLGFRDGQVTSLCPKDPHFPRFEDFELHMEQSESGEWTCWPKPKTRNAGLIGLSYKPGRTQEEAQRRVRAQYLYRSGQERNFFGDLPSGL